MDFVIKFVDKTITPQQYSLDLMVNFHTSAIEIYDKLRYTINESRALTLYRYTTPKEISIRNVEPHRYVAQTTHICDPAGYL